MKQAILMLILGGLIACAAQEGADTARANKEQAIRDLIAVRSLPEVDRIRGGDRDSWEELDRHFLLYTARRKMFLVEFARACHELNEYPVIPDRRRERNTIYARFETIRGCRVDRIYELTEAEAAELKEIGESPGSRN